MQRFNPSPNLLKFFFFIVAIVASVAFLLMFPSSSLFVVVFIFSFASSVYIFELFTKTTLGTNVYGVLAIVSFFVILFGLFTQQTTNEQNKQKLDKYKFVCIKESRKIIVSQKDGWSIDGQFFKKGPLSISIDNCRPIGGKQ